MGTKLRGKGEEYNVWVRQTPELLEKLPGPLRDILSDWSRMKYVGAEIVPGEPLNLFEEGSRETEGEKTPELRGEEGGEEGERTPGLGEEEGGERLRGEEEGGELRGEEGGEEGGELRGEEGSEGEEKTPELRGEEGGEGGERAPGLRGEEGGEELQGEEGGLRVPVSRRYPPPPPRRIEHQPPPPRRIEHQPPPPPLSPSSLTALHLM